MDGVPVWLQVIVATGGALTAVSVFYRTVIQPIAQLLVLIETVEQIATDLKRLEERHMAFEDKLLELWVPPSVMDEGWNDT